MPISSLHLDERQFGELLLTSAQSIFAVMIVLDRRFRTREALLLLVLFLAQFALSVGIEELVPELDVQVRLFTLEKSIFTALYIVFAVVWLFTHRTAAMSLLRYVRRGEMTQEG